MELTVTTAVLTVLAFIVPAAVYLLLRPKRSSRGAQWRSGLFLLVAAINFGALINTHPVGGKLVLQLVLGIGFFIGGAIELMRNRTALD